MLVLTVGGDLVGRPEGEGAGVAAGDIENNLVLGQAAGEGDGAVKVGIGNVGGIKVKDDGHAPVAINEQSGVCVERQAGDIET